MLDSGLPKGGRVAVIVGLGTEMELYRHRARVTLRERFGNEVSPEKRKRAMAYVNRVGTSTSYVSYIGNLVATRVSSTWGFTGPAFTVTEGGNSVFRALDIARELLLEGDVDAAVVAGVDLRGSGALYEAPGQAVYMLGLVCIAMVVLTGFSSARAVELWCFGVWPIVIQVHALHAGRSLHFLGAEQ